LRRDREFVAGALQTLHIKASERAVRLRLARSVIFFALEPPLRIYWHGVTVPKWVGQWQSMQILQTMFGAWKKL
jgi:hypothetical protein